MTEATLMKGQGMDVLVGLDEIFIEIPTFLPTFFQHRKLCMVRSFESNV